MVRCGSRSAVAMAAKIAMLQRPIARSCSRGFNPKCLLDQRYPPYWSCNLKYQPGVLKISDKTMTINLITARMTTNHNNS